MRKLRKSIARYLILALTFFALGALPTYAGSGGPQGQEGSAKTGTSPDKSSADALWELLCQILGL